MKLSARAVGTFLVVAATSTPHFSQAFAPTPTSLSRPLTGSAFVPTSLALPRREATATKTTQTQLSMKEGGYTVGIVGATGAVGKEIRNCLEDRGILNVGKLRIFGSARSAGSIIESSKYGSIDVELFDVSAARECDVVFLAVSGDFALEHAEAICEGDDGAVVIDNSVSSFCLILMCVFLCIFLCFIVFSCQKKKDSRCFLFK